MRSRKMRTAENGAVLVEASIVIGLVLTFLLITVDLGYMFLLQNVANRAAYSIIESAKIDPRFASETRNFSSGTGVSETTAKEFRSARSAAIEAGMRVVSTIAHPSTSGRDPRPLRFRLSNFTGGTEYADAAILFPGQSAVLETPEGEETYRYVRIDKMNDSHCRGGNTPEECTCTATSCPNLYSPGSSSWLAEARRNPPMSLVTIRVKPLLLLRFFRPTVSIVGIAYAAPERAPSARNSVPPGMTCGQMFPRTPGWEVFAGFGRWACEGVTCPAPSSGPPTTCMRVPDSTETIDGSNCGECRVITCSELYSHGGVAGWHFTTTWNAIRQVCSTQAGVQDDPSMWGVTDSFGDLNDNPALNPDGGWGQAMQADCVVCRKPRSCTEAYGAGIVHTLGGCPAGQHRVEVPDSWDSRPSSEITLENCTVCTSSNPQRCSEVNPAAPTTCPEPVFLPDNFYDEAKEAGGCWACQGTCSSKNVSASSACGPCGQNEICGIYSDLDYTSDAACCNRSFKACSDWEGAGTCKDPAVVAQLHAMNKDCRMAGNSASGTCSAIGVCRDTCAAPLKADANCNCVCECPQGSYRVGTDPKVCVCIPAAQGCDPPATSCDENHVLVGSCCVTKN